MIKLMLVRGCLVRGSFGDRIGIRFGALERRSTRPSDKILTVHYSIRQVMVSPGGDGDGDGGSAAIPLPIWMEQIILQKNGNTKGCICHFDKEKKKKIL